MTSTSEPETPSVVDREDRPFVGRTRTLTMQTIKQTAEEIPSLLAWLGQHGVAPAGPPFLRYLVLRYLVLRYLVITR